MKSKDIGDYIVYYDGRIYSKYFQSFLKNNNKKWYKKIFMSGKMVYLHRLIADAFVDNPKKLPCVNHKDGNKLNNNADNLEWCTHKTNMRHAWSTGLIKDVVMGSKHKDSRFTPLQINIVREALENGHKGAKIARYFKVNRSSVYRIGSNEHWKKVA